MHGKKKVARSGFPFPAVFPSPAGMSLTKLVLAGNNIPARDGKTENLFLQCIFYLSKVYFGICDHVEVRYVS